VSCDDSIDNDGDGFTDCADSDCSWFYTCGGTESNCSDTIDNDGDGLTDCADSNCSGLTGPNGETCEPSGEATCNDGRDNDNDGNSDCLDIDCNGINGCEYQNETTCNDIFDNNGDGNIDCLDPTCDGRNNCQYGIELTCNDTIDNDADTTTDCADSDCNWFWNCGGTETSCDDSSDNDGDGNTDCADSDCSESLVCDVTAPNITVYSPTNISYTTYAESMFLINFTATDNMAIDDIWYNNGTSNVTYTSANNITLTSGEYTFTFYANDTAGNVNSTQVSFNVTAYKTITTLRTGWNMFAIQTNQSNTGNDVNISLVAGKYNLIGVSSDSNVAMSSSVDFKPSNESNSSWESAARSGKVKRYMAYYDVSNTSAKKYKYAGHSDASLRGNKGYWVYAAEAGNITLKGVGGSQAGSSVSVDDIRFSNGSLVLDYTDAISESYQWIDSTGTNPGLNYWDSSLVVPAWKVLTDNRDPAVIYSWEGLVIKMLVDNITLYTSN
jgi:hypothetical protein